MSDIDVAREALSQISPSALEYDEWLAVGMALKDAGASFDEWDAWSQRDTTRYRAKEMASKWASFRRSGTATVGIGTIVKLCRDQGGRVTTREHDDGHELDWDAVIGPREVTQVVRQEWLQDSPLPPEPNGAWDGRADFVNYIKAVFDSEDRVGIVAESFEVDGKIMPKRGVWDRTAGELIEASNSSPDLSFVIGDWDKDAGAWVRFNPLDGQGCSDQNVTAFRFALVESDDISVERQYAIYKELELPVAALVHSGSKSLHAIVRIDAADFKEYQKRVDFLYDVCKKNGLAIDRKNRNPSRLSRLPGVTRKGKKQWLVATNIGLPSWAEWADWISAQNDDLPEVENLEDYFYNPPPLSDSLIGGVLRQGHKMLLSGPSKAGKSFLLMQLAVAIAEGETWLSWQCSKGKVLYVNLEVDRSSCYHRLIKVYDSLGLSPDNIKNIDLWQLRGKAMPMTELAPRLIRRALKRKYSAIIIDPIYKVITGDENAADQMAKFCNQFDRVCCELGAAVIYCHHHSKGDQGQKRAGDRASGSGVFARDPDALVDLIELEITDAIRSQYVNRAECSAIGKMLDREAPKWREDVPQDDQVVASHLADWCIKNDLGDELRSVRPEAHDAAEQATGWRIEAVLREYEPFKPVRIWFQHPTHRIDADGLLTDALAQGEEPKRKKTRDQAIAELQAEKIEDYESAYDELKSLAGDEPVTVSDMAERLGVVDKTVRRIIKDYAKQSSLRFKNGNVYRSKKESNDD
ncbi:MAG: AAA family ATPase [Bacilli bacterium]